MPSVAQRPLRLPTHPEALLRRIAITGAITQVLPSVAREVHLAAASRANEPFLPSLEVWMHLENSVVVRKLLAINGRQKHRRVEKLFVEAKYLLRGLLRGVRTRRTGRRAGHSDGGSHRPMGAVPFRPLLDLSWCVPKVVHGVQPPTAAVVVLSLRVGDIPSSLDERHPNISTSLLPEEQLVIQPHILESVHAVDLIGRVPNGQAHAEGLATVGQ
mmetsp:Transcript_93671/g.244403  ORF Transcript_93671/g.244403 Transcript_93671/m.244403 type:complete len:215 (+) Transcript_93671:499-1143(+)